MQRDDEVRIRVSDRTGTPGRFGPQKQAWLKDGPRRARLVTLDEFGDPDAAAPSARRLTCQTFELREDGRGWNYESPLQRWHCDAPEIVKLLEFLQGNVGETGRYRVINLNSPTATLLDLLAEVELSPDDLAAAMEKGDDFRDLVRLLASSAAGQLAAQHAVLEQRRQLVAHLQTLAADKTTNETDLQNLMEDAHWLFGGRYVGVLPRQSIIEFDRYDIPLLAADGSLHIVELKGPVIEGLVRFHRNHWIVGTEVHQATGQAMNYLRSCDELGTGVEVVFRKDLGLEFDLRRVFATVVIGHHDHVRRIQRDAPPITTQVIDSAIRSYNAHLSRVEVVTYNQLLDAASRALTFEQDALDKVSRPGESG